MSGQVTVSGQITVQDKPLASGQATSVRTSRYSRDKPLFEPLVSGQANISGATFSARAWKMKPPVSEQVQAREAHYGSLTKEMNTQGRQFLQQVVRSESTKPSKYSIPHHKLADHITLLSWAVNASYNLSGESRKWAGCAT